MTKGRQTIVTQTAKIDLCRRCEFLRRCTLRKNAMDALRTDVIVTDSCVGYEPAKELTSWQ